MFVPKISYANGSNLERNNLQKSNRVSSQSMGMQPKMSVVDTVSFGTGIDPATLAAIKAIGGVFKFFKTEQVMNAAKKSFEHNDIATGLDIAIQLNEKLGGSYITDIAHNLSGFINKASKYAEKLPDTSYANRDIKQQFLRSVFLKNHGATTGTNIPAAVIPKGAQKLFSELDAGYYGEFKRHIISSIVDEGCYIGNTDYLLSDAADTLTKCAIKVRLEDLDSQIAEDMERWDYSHPPGGWV